MAGKKNVVSLPRKTFGCMNASDLGASERFFDENSRRTMCYKKKKKKDMPTEGGGGAEGGALASLLCRSLINR